MHCRALQNNPVDTMKRREAQVGVSDVVVPVRSLENEGGCEDNFSHFLSFGVLTFPSCPHFAEHKPQRF